MIIVPADILKFSDNALSREWIVSNGAGGYASSTPVGANTRRYHGLLVASFPPPLERQVVLAKVDEELVIGNNTFPLGTNEYHDGTIHPHGNELISEFKLDIGIPTFEYLAGNSILIKQVRMEGGSNTVYISYRLEGPEDALLLIRPFCAFRSYHHCGANNEFTVDTCYDRIIVKAEGLPYSLSMASPGEFELNEDWYRAFLYRIERERGFDCLEDLYTPGVFTLHLSPGEPVMLTATCEDIVPAYRELRRNTAGDEKFEFRKQLLLAAEQFIIRIPQHPTPNTQHPSVLAGYHWFTDWGRDAMIALPGLLLSTGRFSEARDILLRYAGSIDRGMIPNRFTDDGEIEYNTADATLWYFQALHSYLSSSEEWALLDELLPRLKEILDRHISGTRFGIRVDPSDGLLFAGEEGTQLTWMDARVDGRPVTPRIGKPVEINALWYNALSLTADWMKRKGESSRRYQTAAKKCRESFRRKFWNPETGCCYDVIDGPNGNDASIRPNQVFAVSLPHSPLEPEQWKSVVDTVERELLTPFGLRTLSPSDPRYIGEYRGGPSERDSAYHQGTVWPWLIGPFADAHYRIYGNRNRIDELLKPFHKHLEEGCLGSISEVFDGDYPHKPGGAAAQAWSVAEILRLTGGL